MTRNKPRRRWLPLSPLGRKSLADITRRKGRTLLVVLGIVVARRWTNTSGVTKTEAAVIPSRALAVFPFRNASGDAKLDWLGASLGEMLTNDIGQSASLRRLPLLPTFVHLFDRRRAQFGCGGAFALLSSPA